MISAIAEANSDIRKERMHVAFNGTNSEDAHCDIPPGGESCFGGMSSLTKEEFKKACSVAEKIRRDGHL